MSVGGTGVGEDEEDYRKGLSEHYSRVAKYEGPTTMTVDSVEYLGTVEEFISKKRAALAADEDPPGVVTLEEGEGYTVVDPSKLN